ncbi:MAG: tetratricopeptide repeat protein [Rhodospirillaceae bacterium]|nr:tetratricopeptide repeat protein [Rhodospirillaceae bacterium]
MTTDGPSISDAARLLATGAALMDAGRTAEAVSALTGAVVAHPGDAALRMTLGAALRAERQYEAAAIQFLKASRIAPHLAEPRIALAQSMVDAGKPSEALHVVQQSLGAMPDTAALWNLKGALQRRAGDIAGSELSFRRACELAPATAEYLNNLAVAARAGGRLDDAIALYRQALAADPDSARVHGNLGNALDAAGRPDEALPHLRAAVAAAPDDLDAAHNLAVHLIRIECQDEAVPLLRRVVAHDPSRWDSLTNLGVALLAVGRPAEAEACYRRALSLRPGVPETHYDLAWVLLLTGRWYEGWHEYEWRWRLPSFASRPPPGEAQTWDGTPLPEGTLLVYAEQGFGDAIQFVRFARVAKSRVARVVVMCPRPLMRLLSTVPGLDGVVPDTDPPPPADARAAMMSLPFLFGTTPESVPMAEPYIPVPAPRGVLPPKARPRIGFVWAGSPANKIDRQRTCGVAHFLQLMDRVSADFVSLQIGPRAADLARGAPDRLIFRADGRVEDFMDTAALIGELDLVVGVDTAVLHLAAAMGKPTWILLPFMPDYRWLLNSSESPWYRAVRLFRQREKGEWSQVFDDVSTALTHWLRSAG